jgi:ribonuclease Z
MPRLIVLGTANAVSTAEHDNTHFLLQGRESVILIDCGSQPLVTFRRFGVHFNQLTDIILTHMHPDHVWGFPILMMSLTRLGRRKPLRIHGNYQCLRHTENMMQAFSWHDSGQTFPLAWRYVPERKDELVLENTDFRITSWPVRHYDVSTIGMRIVSKMTGKVIGYTCDTAPTEAIVDIGRDADLFFHEAAGLDPYGHSSASQAGQAASEARAGRLILIHYHVWNTDPTPLVEEARRTFDGPVELAVDYQVYDI